MTRPGYSLVSQIPFINDSSKVLSIVQKHCFFERNNIRKPVLYKETGNEPGILVYENKHNLFCVFECHSIEIVFTVKK